MLFLLGLLLGSILFLAEVGFILMSDSNRVIATDQPPAEKPFNKASHINYNFGYIKPGNGSNRITVDDGEDLRQNPEVAEKGFSVQVSIKFNKQA